MDYNKLSDEKLIEIILDDLKKPEHIINHELYHKIIHLISRFKIQKAQTTVMQEYSNLLELQNKIMEEK